MRCTVPVPMPSDFATFKLRISRFLVASPPVRDLLFHAKHLFVAANRWKMCRYRANLRHAGRDTCHCLPHCAAAVAIDGGDLLVRVVSAAFDCIIKLGGAERGSLGVRFRL